MLDISRRLHANLILLMKISLTVLPTTHLYRTIFRKMILSNAMKLSAGLQFAQQYVEAKFVSCRYRNYQQRWQLDFSNCIPITVWLLWRCFVHTKLCVCSMGTVNIRGTNCHILSMPVHKLSSSGRSRYLGTVFLQSTASIFLPPTALQMSEMKISPEVLLVDESGRTVYGDESLLPDLIDHTDNTVFRVTAEDKVYEAHVHNIWIWKPLVCIIWYFLLYNCICSDCGSIGHWHFGCNVFCSDLLCPCMLPSLHFASKSYRSDGAYHRELSKCHQKGIDLTNVRYSCSEIQDIYKAFRDMINEINRLNHTIFNTYTQMYELEMNNRQTEIAFLRSQINPHFVQYADNDLRHGSL